MRVDAKRFEALVEQALDGLPDWIHEHMNNVAVVIAAWPSRTQLEEANVPRGQWLLGLYEGIPLTHRGQGYQLVPPDRITLFQGPLELSARDEQDLVQLIQHTVVHEVAHHFGFSDEQLDEMGF